MYKATFESTFHPELGVETGPGFFSTRPVDGATFIVALVFTALILGSGLFLHQFCLTINRPYRMWGAWLLSILYTTLVAAQSGVLLRILAAGNSEDSRRSVALNLWRAALAIRNATMVLWLAFIRPLTDCVLVPDAGKTIPARLFWLFLCASFLGWYVAIDHSFEHKDPGVRGEAVWIAIGPTSFISTLWLAAFAFLSRRHYPRNDPDRVFLSVILFVVIPLWSIVTMVESVVAILNYLNISNGNNSYIPTLLPTTASFAVAVFGSILALAWADADRPPTWMYEKVSSGSTSDHS